MGEATSEFRTFLEDKTQDIKFRCSLNSNVRKKYLIFFGLNINKFQVT